MSISLQQQTEKCAEMIKRSQKCVLLSGAGMSTNAGIPDFRGPNGIYRQKMETDPGLIFDIYQFYRNPEFFYSFHKYFLNEIEKVKPTFAHYFFAELEKRGDLSGIITQNIDALHQKAGSRKVYEIHGSPWKNYCISCKREYSYEETLNKVMADTVPKCNVCENIIKPDIVFFGENVKYLQECQQMASDADLMIVAGSSLVVTPAALLPSQCRGNIIIVNKGDISFSYLSENDIDLCIEEDIDKFFEGVNTYLNYI